MAQFFENMLRFAAEPALSGDNIIVAAQGAGRRIAVFGYALQGGGTVTAKFTDGASGTQLSMAWSFLVREHTENPPGRQPLWIGTANTALILNLSGATAVGCEVTYLIIG